MPTATTIMHGKPILGDFQHTAKLDRGTSFVPSIPLAEARGTEKANHITDFEKFFADHWAGAQGQ